MLAPLSWLKDYIEITLAPQELAERLSEVGLGCEKITKTDSDVVFEFEVTPNRPDLLSILGIAREIAAIEGKKLKYPRLRQDFGGQAKKQLPLEIKTDYRINPRFTGIVIDNIKVGESPHWLKERLTKVGQRPINNIVDITNYVMFELGNPLHAFDYDKIEGQLMRVHQTKNGEKFKSVDGITYHLPQGAVVISDQERIIDLCGIKGGKNSGAFPKTKTIFVRVPVEVPGLIRRTSQTLGLRSEASSIFEKGVNAGGTIEALARCTDLILELAGGEIVSNLYDLKEEDFNPWKVKMRLSRLTQLVGVRIEEKTILKILTQLNLLPYKIDRDAVETTIPTYRNDLKIEEDLVEEVVRLYGYNNFPKTLPTGVIPTLTIPYFKDYRIEEKVKEILVSCGFSEIYTYSLVSEANLTQNGFDPQDCLRVDNPVSREFEYLRPSLKIGLRRALEQNKPNFSEISLFELGKVYLGKNLDKREEEDYLAGISNAKSFYEVKGVLQRLFEELGINEDPTPYIKIRDGGVVFGLNFSQILKRANFKKIYKPLPKHPPIIEDLAVVADPNIETGLLIAEIRKQSSLVVSVSLLDWFENTRTFHLVYQNRERNLTNEEVSQIREKILKALEKKFGARLKE